MIDSAISESQDIDIPPAEMKKVDKDQFLEETNYKNTSDKSSKLNSENSSKIKRNQEFDLSEFDFQCQNYITSKEESDILKRFQHN
jgi:hypothetical protein